MPIIQSGMPLTPQLLTIATGEVLVSGSGASMYDTVVNFGFTFLTPPRVIPQFANASGTVANWQALTVSITTTQFTLRVRNNAGATATWSNVPVRWIAIPA